ncbi:hypothetical protein [Caulobacter sp. RL271]|jgi:hypothetical protein|uniref:Lipoprotein n=1 Tax=Caulobacter segnis TaxID=88688 RepID=A0ABY5A0C7_9CAUL|nr:hypothetical protein [Caulobacter segnis]USQ97707.1 hypothetical protein MZV50_09310 [Caulobacter segnis]
MASRIAPVVVLGLLAAGLTGCAHEKVAQDGYHWAYLESAAEAPRLAYGRPNSDDVVLMLSCSPGQDRVDVSAVGLSGGEIVLASGRAESRFAAAQVDDAMAEGGLLEARGKTSAPALDGFRKSGDLALLTKGERHSLAAGSADRGNVKAFFRACGA